MDLEAIKARLAGLAAGRGGSGKGGGLGQQWKPKDEHECRLLPYPFADEPFIEMNFHYDIGDSFPILCPRNFSDDCVICDFADDLKSWKDVKTGKDKPEAIRKADFEMFRKLQAKQRYFVWMVERGKEEEGPKYWSCSFSVYNAFLKICADQDYNDGRKDGGGAAILTSPDAGHDFHVSFQKPGEKGNNKTFHNTEIKERKKPTKLLDDKKKQAELLAAVPKLESVIQKLSSKEVEIVWKKFLNSGEKTAENKPGGDTTATEKYATNSAEKPPIGGRSVDDALDDLVNS